MKKLATTLMGLLLLASLASCGKADQSADVDAFSTSEAYNSEDFTGGNCSFSLVSDYNSVVVACGLARESDKGSIKECIYKYEKAIAKYGSANCQARSQGEEVTVNFESFKKASGNINVYIYNNSSDGGTCGQFVRDDILEARDACERKTGECEGVVKKTMKKYPQLNCSFYTTEGYETFNNEVLKDFLVK